MTLLDPLGLTSTCRSYQWPTAPDLLEYHRQTDTASVPHYLAQVQIIVHMVVSGTDKPRIWSCLAGHLQ